MLQMILIQVYVLDNMLNEKLDSIVFMFLLPELHYTYLAVGWRPSPQPGCVAR